MLLDLGFIDLDKIAESGQCFRWEKTDDHEYIIPACGKTLKVRQSAPDVIDADCTIDEWHHGWAAYFDAYTDYRAIVASIDPKDEYLTRAAEAAHGIRILKQSLWEVIASFIISQNNNIPRIKTTIKRMCDTFGDFPSASRLTLCDHSIVRSFGLGYRDTYLLDAAIRYLCDEPESEHRSDSYAEARAYYLTYKGIGEKVADCICLYGLGHKEAFPIDVWMKRIVGAHYKGRFPVEQYKRSAGVLQQFMFYYERSSAGAERDRQPA